MFRYSLIVCLQLLFCGLIQAQTPNLQLLGHLAYPGVSLAGCWHHVDSAGTEYGLIGTSQGLSIVNLSNPAQPQQVFTVPGLTNNWRELKTWNGFAYIGSEAGGSGITIVDLRSLPDTVYYQVWTGDSSHVNQVRSSHALTIADGFLYINGGSTLTNGVIICDLVNPWNPQIVGTYTSDYVHDSYVRGDTLWASAIYKGEFQVIDISDKANPILLATNPTPGLFNHNTWLSDDSKTLFAADEKSSAPLAAFDVSDLNNIQLLDTYLPSVHPNGEVHNVRVFGNFLINPSYSGQLTLVDATHPDNLIETANVSLGSSLVWDANPFLPSGIIFATAKAEGLFIYQPNYQPAAYLEGVVLDTVLGTTIAGVTLKVVGTDNTAKSKADGSFKTGAAQAGLYTISVEKPGYASSIISNVNLQIGEITQVIGYLSDPVATRDLAVKEQISVFPTVFNQCLSIEVGQNSVFSNKETCITLADLNGKTVLESSFYGNKTEICTSQNLAAGHYLLFLQNENGRSQPQRIIKS
jgi:choice-of-anchor B domain-containing protein